MLYRPSTSGTTAPALTLTGRNLAHAHRSNAELALIGAGLHLNRFARQPYHPTMRGPGRCLSCVRARRGGHHRRSSCV